MTQPHITAVARAVRAHTRMMLREHTNMPVIGIVLSLASEPDGLQIELTDSGIVLDGDAITLSSQVRLYDRDVGIMHGDSILVVPAGHGDKPHDWVAVSVQGRLDRRVGVSGVVVAATGPATGLVGKIRAYDANGNPLGWVPVYTSIP